MVKFTDRLRRTRPATVIIAKLKMLTVLPRILMLGCGLMLAACASLSIPQQPSDDYIAALLDSNDFATALKAVDKWQVNEPGNIDLPKQRKQITQAIGQFELNTLNAAKKLDAEGKWQETKTLYENALDKLPSSQSLQNAYSEFSVRHLMYINALKEDLDVAQAKHWLSINDGVESIYSAAPNDAEARAWKAKRDAEREPLARRLVNYGLAHEGNKRFGTAALRYDLAYQLEPGEFTKPYHERAVKTFAQQNAKQQQRARVDQQRQQSKLGQLIEQFDGYLAAENFSLARQTLGAMEVIDAKSPDVRDRKARLNSQRNIALNKSIQEGREFYTKGEFDNAINAWTQALQLDPGNKELKENIQRARKFRENLERLKPGS